MFRVSAHATRTDTGRLRSGNEDNHYVRVPLFALADGMGGAQAGEVASQLTIDIFRGGVPESDAPIDQRLAQLVQAANVSVYEHSHSDRQLAGMGTTCTAAYLGPDYLALAHVGDSRAYRWRGGELLQLTDDHSLVGELVRRGKITAEEAEDHPQRSIITRALGQEREVAIDYQAWSVSDRDLYLLCTDGLTDMVPDHQIAESIARGGELEQIAGRLVEQANEAGGRDNITVLLFAVEEISGPTDAAKVTVPEVEPSVSASDTVAIDAAIRPGNLGQYGPPPGGMAVQRRRRWPPALRVAVVLAVLVGILGSAGWIGTRSMYFVGTDDEGLVTLYQGLPYALPLLPLYQEKYISGLPARTLPTNSLKLVRSHRLRSQDDAVDLVRQLERGTVGGDS